MKLCYDDVKNWGLDIRGLKFFKHNCLEPVELIDIINHPEINIEDLQFGFNKLSTKAAPEEMAAYFKRVGVDEISAPFVFICDHITNSKLVSNSSFVSNSEHIGHSQEIEDSKYVENCQVIKRSEDIYISKYITNSQLVSQALNVSDSRNVVRSNYIMNSNGVIDSNWVNKSTNIINSSRVANSAFCKNTINIENCLFCTNIQNKQYYIFNQPASEWVFNFTKDQLQHYNKYEMNLLQIIRTELYPEFPLSVPHVNWFKAYPESFYEWLKTIPLYDNNVMLELTLDKRFNI